jgi:ABC-type transport system substrate-binding protein
MKRRNLLVIFSLLVVAAMVLAACGKAAPATTSAPATTEPVVATTVAPTVEFTPSVFPVESNGLLSETAPDCEYGGEFKSIEAVDQYTVKFSLCYPDPAFASKVAFSVFAIQDSDYLDANNGDSVKMSEQPNGTGPYKVVTWNRGDSIVYEAYEDYWGDAPFSKNLIFRWSEQSAQRLLELQAGTVNGIDNPGPDDIATIKADPTLQFVDRPGFNIFYIGFNNTIAPFDNLNVRKAIAYAIDRERIVDQYYPAGSDVANSFVPDFVLPGASPDIKWYEFDQAKAKEELTTAGYSEANPLKITMSFRVVDRAYLPSPDKVAQEIQAQLAEVGIEVELKEMESAAFIDATSAGQEGFYLLGWNADYPDATNFYDYHFDDENNKQFGDLYPDMQSEIDAAAKLSDATARQAHYDTVNQLLKDYVMMIPVAHGGSGVAYQASVEGAQASPLGNEYFSAVNNGTDTFVWMQNGEPSALWCSDETDGETLRACEQVYEALLAFEINGTTVIPALAESYVVNDELTEYTFTLRQGVTYHNGATFEANDVVASFIAQWDAASPNHVGRTGTFEYFGSFFGSFVNSPPAAE